VISAVGGESAEEHNPAIDAKQAAIKVVLVMDRAYRRLIVLNYLGTSNSKQNQPNPKEKAAGCSDGMLPLRVT
jgi:hypothetical protein